MLRSRNPRAMSQHDEMLPVSLGLFSGPVPESSSLVDAVAAASELSEEAPQAATETATAETAAPQDQVLEGEAIVSLEAEIYSLTDDGPRQAYGFTGGDGEEIAVPLGSSLEPGDGPARYANDASPVMSSSYAVRLSIDVVATEDSHSGVAMQMQSEALFGLPAAPQSPDQSSDLFALETWSVEFTAASASVGITAEGAALVASTSGSATTLVVSSMTFASVNGSFDIVIRYSGSATYQAAFTDAAARWAQIIIADIPDFNSSQYGLIDDLLIDASIVSIDGRGGILGQAGPDLFRTSGSRLPAHGVMQFDSADVANMYSNGTWTGVILHEMGHILGIGTKWNGLLNSAGNYIGTHALDEYRALIGNPNATAIPVEHDGGAGTAGAHWDEDTFNNELMTGWVDLGAMPISRMTVGSLEDMGYVVNYAAADPYTVPSAQADDFADSLADTTAPFGNVAVNGSVSGTLEVLGDHDFIRVQLVSGVAYSIGLTGSTGGGGTLSDPYLRLYNSAGTLVGQNDDIVLGSNQDSLLTFTPTASGTYYVDAGAYNNQSTGTYRVTVSTSNVVDPSEVVVTGNSTNIADGDTSPSFADNTDFGGVLVGSTVIRTFTVTNTGTGTLTISNLKIPAGFVLVDGLSTSIAPGASDTFQVRLDTAKAGVKSGQITFTTNDADEAAFNFAISGLVVTALLPEIAVSGNGINIVDNDKTPSLADDTNFGSVNLGGAGVIHTFTVTNSGLADLTTANLVVPAGFTIVKGFSGPIAPGGSDTLQIQLDTTSTGTKTGKVSFTTNDSNESAFDFQITGVVAPVPVLGDDNDNVFFATANTEPFFGFGGIDTVSYANASAVSGVIGVTVSLLTAAKSTGFAVGDTFNSVENLIGSAFNDRLTGDKGNNVLEGGAGADLLDGGLGIDTASYAGSTTGVVADMTNSRNNTGDATGDVYKNIENLRGSAQSDVLVGNKVANTIRGAAGNDTLTGMGGFDDLYGGAGSDVFKFVAANLGADTIRDFVAGQDAIGIVKSGFKINASVALGQGDVFDFEQHYFVSGPGTALGAAGVLATESGHGQFLFNQATDQLFWDVDGLGKKAAILIAQFSTDTDLHATDFILF